MICSGGILLAARNFMRVNVSSAARDATVANAHVSAEQAPVGLQ
jgi:hypothetical protein